MQAEGSRPTEAASAVVPADLEGRIFAGLNPEQTRAVRKFRGPVVILAGAGSGKTTTITRRIAWQVVRGGLDPKNILAVTFTTKAAAEMRERLQNLGVGEVPARTFHSAAQRQLTVLGEMNIDLMPAKTRLLVDIRNGLPQAYRSLAIGDFAEEIERAKSARATPDSYLDTLDSHVPPLPAELMQQVFAEYERRKRAARKLDYEDLLEQTIRMFEADSAVWTRFERRYRAFTVDEYQDVNQLQQALLDCWLGGRDDVCVVGDDYQAIFGFTGASPRFLGAMSERYPNTTLIKLETNYRSTPQVLAWANRLAPRLEGAPKTLRPVASSGPEPTVTAYPTEAAETTGVAARVQELLRAGVAPGEIAVLYRINAWSTPFEQEFHRARIPFQVARGGFVERAAWKSARHAFARRASSMALLRSVEQHLEDAGFVAEIQQGEVSPQEYTRQVDLAFIRDLAHEHAGNNEEAVADFVRSVEESFATYGDGTTRDAVRLTTYHLAKGLEWEAVFLPRLNEGALPFWKSTLPEEIAEERRLFYVGLTRARRILELSTSGVKFPSRFIAEAAPPTVSSPAVRSKMVVRKSSAPKPKTHSTSGTPRSPMTPTLRARLAPGSWHPFKNR